MSKTSIVLISNLYPNMNEPTRGLFIKQLADSIAKTAEICVISPIPFNPIELIRKKNKLPKFEVIDGITVYHPRYIVIPKMLRSVTGWFFYLGIKNIIKTLIKQGKADVISTHWVYPDGYGSTLAAKKFNLPVAVHALGCDINEYTKFPIRRKLITQALTNSDINIVKSQELKTKIEDLGIDKNKTKVVHNGVNQQKFKRVPKTEARKKLGLNEQQRFCLFVGNFQIEKGLNFLISAFEGLRELDVKLLVIGSGPLESEVKQQVAQSDLQDKINFIGRVDHSVVPDYLAAADLLCLPSLREGCPNVVLESLSCGTPVVASNVGAVSDIITKPEFGVVVSPENPEQITQGIIKGLSLDNQSMPEFEWYNWERNAEIVLSHIEGIKAGHKS